MAKIKLERAEFFTTPADHVFHFEVEPGNGVTFTIPVVVANVAGLDALWQRAHENLVTVLEKALEAAKAHAEFHSTPKA